MDRDMTATLLMLTYLVTVALAYKAIQKTVRNPEMFHFIYTIVPLFNLAPILHYLGNRLAGWHPIDWKKFFNRF